MNFPSFEGIASMFYFVFLFFSGICSYVHFLITNYCSFVFTVYKGGVCTGIFIPGFGSTRTYETLNFIRHELSLLSCLTKVLRPNKLPSSIKNLRGTSNESVPPVDPIDQIFDKFKSY